MRAIVTDEQRRSRTEAGLPSIYFASLKRGDPLRKVRYAPFSLLVAPQNRPDHCKGICETLH